MKPKKLGRWVAVAALGAAVALLVVFGGGVGSAQEYTWNMPAGHTIAH